jgi:RNA polymerase sigma-70 factor (ECF subfamily)
MTVSPTLDTPAADPTAGTPEVAIELSRLVAAASAGDLAAQSELVRRYTPRIVGFLRTLVFQPSAIEDLAQTTLVKMVRQFPALRDPAVFENWLFAIARNTAMDFLRQHRRWQATFAPGDGEYDAPDQNNPRALREILDALDFALRPLPPIDQRLIRLLIQGNSYRTIAARTGLSVIMVRGRLCRARPMLRMIVGTETGTRVGAKQSSRVPLRLPRAA